MNLKIENIGIPYGAKKKRKRLGRGIGSGHGKTSGRGHKGAKSRAGGGVYTPGFEGGQMPLVRRIPKRGFTNKFKTRWGLVNIGTLERCADIQNGMTIGKEFLFEKGLLRKRRLPYKVLGKGKITKAITLEANSFSQGAKAAIENAGGKAISLPPVGAKASA